MLSIVASAPMILLMLASSATSFQSVSFRPTSALLQISALSRRSPLSFNIQEITCSSSERIPFLKRRRLSARSRCSALCAHASVPGDNLPHVPPTLLPGMKQVLFIETGFGADQHGQNVTKAAVRACRNAIEFNSIPSIAALIPGGYDRMALRVSLAVPPAYAAGVDIAQVEKVFPYGKCDVEIVAGGAVFTSGIALPALQDRNDDMLIAIAHVAVGEMADVSAPALPSPRSALHVQPDVDFLVDSLIEMKKKRGAQQLWVGVAGPPGSGKSTVTNEVAATLCKRGCTAVVLPMDGFHYSKAALELMPDPEHAMLRRGAPFTFDAPSLVSRLTALRSAGEGRMPAFDHAIGDPEVDKLCLLSTHQVVLVEGNYLLLWDEPVWKKLQPLFHTTWYIDCPLEVLRERVIERNSAAWGWSRTQTAIKVDANDMLNARLVASTKKYAQLIVATHPQATATTVTTVTKSLPAVVASADPIVEGAQVREVVGMRQALFIETGFGACQKGLDVTKAAVRACRNAIEFNSVPAIRVLCSKARGDMVVRVSVAVPKELVSQVDVSKIKEVFPHGDVYYVDVLEGGGRFCSGVREVDGLEKTDEMIIAVAHVVVGVK